MSKDRDDTGGGNVGVGSDIKPNPRVPGGGETGDITNAEAIGGTAAEIATGGASSTVGGMTGGGVGGSSLGSSEGKAGGAKGSVGRTEDREGEEGV
jgi:hypothetical protein